MRDPGSPPRSSPAPRAPRRAQPPGGRPARHLALGARGEARAAEHLAARGYRITARNIRAGGVELDLVAERGGVVVFVEVKTRRSGRQGGGEAAVGTSKQQRLVRGAVAWLASHGMRSRRVRFDVMAWQVDRAGTPDERWHLTHYEGAFDASG